MASIIKNTGYLYLKVVLNIFISLYTTRLVLNSLGTDDFGIWGIIGGAIAFLSFLNPALSAATQRYLSFYEGQGNIHNQKKVFSISILLHLLSAIIIIVMLELFAYPLFNGILNISLDKMQSAIFVYQCLIISMFFTFLTVPYDATINAHEDMKFYAFVGIIQSLLNLFAAFFISLDMIVNKLEIYGICNIVITIVILLTMFLYSHRSYKEYRFDFSLIDRKGLLDMSKFAFWNLTGSFTNILGNYGSGIVTNHFFGTRINAVLSITGQLGGYLNTFSVNMLKAVNPVIVKNAGRGDNDSLLKYTMASCRIAFLLFSFFAVPVLIATPYVLQVWLKNVPDWTVLFVRIYFVRVFFEQITSSLKTAINANGKIAGLNISSSLSQLLTLPILYFAFKIGFEPYWNLIICMIFMAIIPGFIQLYYAKKNCSLSLAIFAKEVILRAMPCTILSFVIAFVVCSLLHVQDFIEFIVATSVHIFVFVVLVYNISLNEQERIYICNFLKVKLKIK